jgi:hypothetical protein
LQLAELFYKGEEHKIRLAAQIGITHAIVSTAPTLADVPRSRYVAELQRIKEDLKAAGLIFAGVESHPVLAEKIKLGLPGRDEEIENYQAVIRALGQLGELLFSLYSLMGRQITVGKLPSGIHPAQPTRGSGAGRNPLPIPCAAVALGGVTGKGCQSRIASLIPGPAVPVALVGAE